MTSPAADAPASVDLDRAALTSAALVAISVLI
jgi:hypothetical protein